MATTLTLPQGWTPVGTVQNPAAKSPNLTGNVSTNFGRSWGINVSQNSGVADVYSRFSVPGGGDRLIGTLSADGNNFQLSANGRSYLVETFNISPSEVDTNAKAENWINTNILTIIKRTRADFLNTYYEDYTGNFNSSLSSVPGFAGNPIGNGPTTTLPAASSTSTSTSATGSSNIFSIITENPLSVLTGIGTQLTKGDEILKKFNLLKYPQDILDGGQDTLVITQFRYNPPRGEIFKDAQKVKEIFENGLKRNSATSETLVTVILPAPNNANDSNNVGWGPDNMNNLTAAAAGSVLTDMGGAAAAGVLGGATGGILSLLTGAGGAGQGAQMAIQLKVLADLYSKANNSKNAKSIAGTAIASKALNMAGFEVSPESILASGAGVIPNSNLELLFNAPTLREFTFEYRLSPRSSDEAKIVKNIIRSFKQGMAPRKVSANGAGGYFLATPNVFKLEYKTEGNSIIQGANRFKICALTGFSVNYTPDGQWAAYEGGQPVSYIIRMSYTELDPVYENDYYDETSDANLEKIDENEIGY